MSAVDILFWICMFILWHGALYLVHRYRMMNRVEAAWTLGHKLGRTSALMGKERIDAWLTEAGIKLSDLPPVE